MFMLSASLQWFVVARNRLVLLRLGCDSFMPADRSDRLVHRTDGNRTAHVLSSAVLTGFSPDHIVHFPRLPEADASRLVGAYFGGVLIALCSKSQPSAEIALARKVFSHGFQKDHFDSAPPLVDPTNLVAG